MLRVRVTIVLVFLCLVITPAFAKSHVPTKNTHAAIKAYVESAAKFIAKNGADCKALEGPEWRSGDYYVFVDEPGGKSLCHPNPKIVGTNATDIVDSNGKKVGVELEAAAAKKGGGWVDYVWPRPGTDKPVAKSSYAMTVKGPDGKAYIVGAGGYELK